MFSYSVDSGITSSYYLRRGGSGEGVICDHCNRHNVKDCESVIQDAKDYAKASAHYHATVGRIEAAIKNHSREVKAHNDKYRASAYDKSRRMRRY